MANIKYKITFHSHWHCGSGLSAGADLDALVIKNKEGLPFIPGKTLKGLIREATEEYVTYCNIDKRTAILKSFGHMNAQNSDDIECGEAFFSNAEFFPEEKNDIIKYQLQDYLYKEKSSTKIDNSGIADDHSLRRIETVVPCSLYAEILNIDDNLSDVVTKAMGLIKRLGVNRNRGLGRCTFTIIK